MDEDKIKVKRCKKSNKSKRNFSINIFLNLYKFKNLINLFKLVFKFFYNFILF